MKNVISEYCILKNTFNKEIAKNKLLEKVWGRLGKISFFENQAVNFYRRKHKTILEYLNTEFDVFLSNYVGKYNQEEINVSTNKIFSMWIQGVENAPLIVKKTIESQKRYAEKYGYEYILLDKNNIFTYVEFPEIIIEKYQQGIIDFIKFSDIVRVALLAKYGGVWLDSTIYIETTEKLEYFDNDFFTIRMKNNEKIPKFVPQGKWTGFCLAGKQSNILFEFLRDFQVEYFSKFDVAIDYFLIDYLIEIAYEKFETVKEKIDLNPLSNPELFFLAKNISKEYQADIHKSVRLKAMGKFFVNSAATTLKTIITGSGLNFILDSLYTSEYEKQKHQYENILYKYYTHKYDEPYAVKNISLAPMSKDTKEYLYYPMQIHSSFMNVDLKRTIIGGRLSSGGLDYHKFFYYDINDIYTKTNSSLSKNMPLNKLIAYLCLDELRTTYKDDQSFFNHLKNHDMPFEPKELMVAEAKRPLDISNSSFMDIIKRWAINSMYSVGTEEEVDVPIDKYNEAMEILQDFKEGNFNTGTTDKETITDNKARRLLKALDVIGANNIKGLYVGCKSRNGIDEREIPPRLVGRLATTIIMEDGLFLG